MDKNIEIIGIIDAKRNKNLIQAYSREPFTISLFPDVLFEPAELSADDLQRLRDIEQFDWIVFTDPNAASLFPDLFESSGRELFDLDSVNICSFGEMTSDELRFRQIHSDVVPSEFSPKEVADEIAVYAQADLPKLNFLVLSSGGGVDTELCETLAAENAKCDALVIAKPSVDGNHEYLKSRSLLLGGSVDKFLFGSDREVIDTIAYYGIETLRSLESETDFTGTNTASSAVLDMFRLSKRKKAGAKSSGPK